MLLIERKKTFLVLSAIGVLVLVGSGAMILLTLAVLHANPKAQTIGQKSQTDIENEFRQISPLPKSVVIQSGSMSWPDHGITNAAYKSEESYESIKGHYNNELTNHGWSFRKEADLKYDGVDYGGKELMYCKGYYAVHLQYAARQEREFGWTFSFAMTWGNSDNCR